VKKIEARKYVGGVNDQGFEKLVAHGLKEIRIDGFLRYDKKDIDELMAKYKLLKEDIHDRDHNYRRTYVSYRQNERGGTTYY
ncbi:hypothetical protein GBB77_11305, partial [Bifidobacterium longum]